MAIADTKTAGQALQGLSDLPIAKQLGVMIGLAASIALGVMVVLWSKEPLYQPLMTNIEHVDASRIVEILQQSEIPTQIDTNSGIIMVPSEFHQKAKLKLAAEGLSRGQHTGFELLDKKKDFGTSHFMEIANFRRALEGELARTISAISSVKSARVHLAIPKDSVFVRDRREPRASVFVDLLPGRKLTDEQISAVTHMVSSSVPELDNSKVTVIDQKGRLLTTGDNLQGLMQRQYQYARNLENNYVNRILNLLEPIVGIGKVRAQVTADIDFTRVEKTQETFNGDSPAVRSEQINEQRRNSGAEASGVPGALSNQPLGPEATEESSPAGQPTSKSETKNYELDKTVSHTKQQYGKLMKLSVAVLLDNHDVAGEGGETTSQPLTEEEINRVKTLVREAVGYNELRGDSIEVINSTFKKPEAIAPVESTPFYQKSWFWSSVRQGLAGIFILILLFAVIKPMLKNLAQNSQAKQKNMTAEGQVALPPGAEAMQYATPQALPGTPAMAHAALPPQLPQPPLKSFEEQVGMARNVVSADPARVAQVVKTWMNDNA